MKIPQTLSTYFADSTLRLRSYNSTSRELCIHIEKDIGPESGMIRFVGVSFVSVPDCFSGDGIDAVPVADADDSFWGRTSCHVDCVEKTETIYRLHDQDGPVHFVVADSIDYEIEPNGDADA